MIAKICEVAEERAVGCGMENAERDWRPHAGEGRFAGLFGGGGRGRD